jgi:outer membrane protein OmpA-like peptidoglycan-associated protein
MKMSSWIFLGLFLLGCAGTQPKQDKSSIAPIPDATYAASFKAFPVYTDRSPRNTHYVPSGYMGDSDLTMSGAYVQTPNGAQGPSLRANYKAKGPSGWSGLYWQDPANNWGESAGRAGYDLRGAKKLTFWARGLEGGERIHEFRVGGIVGPYPDSDVASLSNVRLTKDWKQYTIDLSKKDLRHIIGGFGFMILKAENPSGASFFIDDIFYEGDQSVPEAVVSTATAFGQTAVPPVAPPTPVMPTPAPVVKSKDMEVKETEAGLRVSFSSRVLFEAGKSVLASGSSRALDQLIGLLSAYPTNRVLIEGHTDKSGNAEFNLKLSELRARSVRDYLIKQGGFEAARFDIIGYGATRPVADNNTAVGRSLNRRVEVTILKNAK